MARLVRKSLNEDCSLLVSSSSIVMLSLLYAINPLVSSLYEQNILVGLNYNGFFPTGGEGDDCVGHLKVLSTQFGNTGWILGGYHPDLKCLPPKFTAIANQVRVNRINLEVVPKIMVDKIRDREVDPKLTPEYYQVDHLGIEPP